jgi:hypothetical protein
MTDEQQRDPKLEKLYGASRAEEPSAQTDAAIKRLARESLSSRKKSSAWVHRSAWAIAASLVLGVTVLLQWPEPMVDENSALMRAPALKELATPAAKFEVESEAAEPEMQDAPTRETSNLIEHLANMVPAPLVDCESDLPEQLDDEAAWHRRIQELIDAGATGQAMCLITLYQDQFNQPFEFER